MSGIQMALLGTAQGPSITLGFDANFDMTSDGNSPSTQQASFTLGTDATVSSAAETVTSAATRWGSPTTVGIGSNFEVRLEVSSLSVEASVPTLVQFAGVNVTSVGNTAYYALSSARSLVVQATSNPTVGSSDLTSIGGTVRIREIANTANETTATFSMLTNADF